MEPHFLLLPSAFRRHAYDVPSWQRLTREFLDDRRGAGSLTINDHVAGGAPAAFEFARITLRQFSRTGTRLRISAEHAARTAEVIYDGAELEIATDTINQPPHPTQITFRWTGDVRTATLRVVVRPARFSSGSPTPIGLPPPVVLQAPPPNRVCHPLGDEEITRRSVRTSHITMLVGTTSCLTST